MGRGDLDMKEIAYKGHAVKVERHKSGAYILITKGAMIVADNCENKQLDKLIKLADNNKEQ